MQTFNTAGLPIETSAWIDYVISKAFNLLLSVLLFTQGGTEGVRIMPQFLASIQILECSHINTTHKHARDWVSRFLIHSASSVKCIRSNPFFQLLIWEICYCELRFRPHWTDSVHHLKLFETVNTTKRLGWRHVAKGLYWLICKKYMNGIRRRRFPTLLSNQPLRNKLCCCFACGLTLKLNIHRRGCFCC